MSEALNYRMVICPLCDGTMQVHEHVIDDISAIKTCGACRGEGAIRVPNGHYLAALPDIGARMNARPDHGPFTIEYIPEMSGPFGPTG